MGQGSYWAVVFGACGDQIPADDAFDWDAAWEKRNEGLELPGQHYESRIPWVGFAVAATSGMDTRDSVEVERTAMPLADLISYIETNGAQELIEVKAKWDAWRAAFPVFPEGQLIFVADYD